MKRKLGIFYLIFAVIITIILWIFSKDSISIIFDYPFRSLSQIMALVGTVLLSSEYILATRLHFLEDIFGGLDKLYKTHHFAGAIGLTLILYHPLFLIVNVLPQTKAALLYILPSVSNIPYALGILALSTFLIILAFTFYITLPYHLWKMTHNLLGIPLLLFSAHIYLISSDISTFLLLRLWILFFVVLALISYIYKRFWYEKFSRSYLYNIVGIKRYSEVIEITLKPEVNKIRYLPGQFVFIKIKDRKIGEELHPYSIVSAPNEDNLKLSIKVSGDYTSRMFKELTLKTLVSIYGPYGKLSEQMLVSNKEMIWIAGGIGVTPFLSMLKYETLQQNERKIHFYYCIKNQAEAIYDKEISNMVRKQPQVIYHKQCSVINGRINAQQVVKDVPNLKGTNIFLCGPKIMMENLANQFIELGVHPRNIIFEDFSFIV